MGRDDSATLAGLKARRQELARRVRVASSVWSCPTESSRWRVGFKRNVVASTGFEVVTFTSRYQRGGMEGGGSCL
jgi:hypothetical protein